MEKSLRDRRKSIPVRIVVTGSRGKSSLTRLLHAALNACGIRTYSRITGVVPRELAPSTPNGEFAERVIRRCSPAHVREMLWWFSQVPCDAEAVVIENSAVAPDLQFFAADLLDPTLVVWTTLRADHEEVWGRGREGAAHALMRGVPKGIAVVGGPELRQCRPLLKVLEKNANLLITSDSDAGGSHIEENISLAGLVCQLCGERRGFDPTPAEKAMRELPADFADFRVMAWGSDELAVAFSANDPKSTSLLFEETGWRYEETTLLYHHRVDREARLRTFASWIEGHPWREKIFTRNLRTLSIWPRAVWSDAIVDVDSFKVWMSGRGKVFACGNVAGWPIEFLRTRGV